MSQSVKVLRSSTIIRDDLYVDRDADRQLDAIIEEMGRPGYVLVARQMGKTNLLLRMKRRREIAGEIVLYYDLSTPFETARDLFRYVVDGLVDRLDDDALSCVVNQERHERSIDPNAEYDRHIRLALGNTKVDRVIIVLDEIDSLVGRDYSDRVLAQIRSMYFARANHDVYERLTYVLSGVAEPTDLIKDKNISPFNIGEKIYLADFSLSEVEQLLRKAGLELAGSVVEAIYGWASGNPRMTWDICSALEDVGRSGEAITPTAVDIVVERLYLTRQDRPPIDHIRALAETDQKVRSALMSLLYGRGDTLDDNAKSRLYLAGITSASATEPPKLKNRVIEMALSEAWLTQVETKLNGITNTAANFYREGNYGQAISLYEQFVEQTGGPDALDDVQLLELAMSQYKLSRFNEAKASFQNILDKTKSRDFRNSVRFRLASAYLLSDEAAMAIPLLEEVVKFNGSFKLQAKHAIASAHLAISKEIDADFVVDLTREVLVDMEADHDLSEIDVAELRAASYYTLAQALLAKKDDESAQSALDAAVDAIDREHLPGLAALVISLITDADRRVALLTNAVNILSKQKPALSTAPIAFEFKAESLVRLVDAAIRDKQQAIFDRLLGFALSVGEGSRFDRLYRLARLGTERNKAAVSTLLRLAFQDREVIAAASREDKLEAVRLWLSISDEPDNSAAFQQFVALVREGSTLLHETDLFLIINRFTKLLTLALDNKALDLINFTRLHADFFRARNHPIFALYVQHEMALFHRLGDMERERASARELLHLTASSTIKNLGLKGRPDPLMDRLRTAARAALASRNSSTLTDVGRNDLVIVRSRATGFQRSVKFKKVSEQVLSGEVVFVRKVEKPQQT